MADKKEVARLQELAYQMRVNLVKLCGSYAGNIHMGGDMSMSDVLTCLFHHTMNIDPKDIKMPTRDRFILSKGHGAVCMYITMALRGFFDYDEIVRTYGKLDSAFGQHPCKVQLPGVETSTGSLGHGIPIAAGTAIAARVLGKDYYTYVVTGDGELDEGSNWEGLMTIRHYNLTNCITIVDRNHCMIDGNTEDVMKLEPLADKFVAFGFHTIVCEGNNIVSLCKAIDEAHKTKDKPTVIVADTIKGVGIKLTSGNYKWHYGAIDEEMAKVAAKDLDEYSAERIARCGKEFE